jgi:hypothetical protein
MRNEFLLRIEGWVIIISLSPFVVTSSRHHGLIEHNFQRSGSAHAEIPGLGYDLVLWKTQ